MEESNTVDRMTSYEIKGLFQPGNDFQFDLNPGEPTILTGGNGSGKSTVLRSIDAICTEQWQLLDDMPFEEVTIRYESGRMLRVKHTEMGMQITTKGHQAWVYVGEKVLRKNLPDRLRHMTAHSRTRVLRAYSTGAGLNSLSAAERQRLYELTRELGGTIGPASAPDWVHDIASQIPVLFVTDQRLMLESTGDSEPGAKPEGISTRTAVDQAVQKVRHLMSDALSEYAATSQRLDRDFPKRVVAAMSTRVRISDKKLREKLFDNDEQARALQRVGLLPDDVSPSEFTDFEGDDVKAVIATHAEDTAKKLAVLAPLRERLTLFANFLTQHYSPKRLVFSPGIGFAVLTPNGKLIMPPQLSSGEKQMLVLAYQILFKAESGTLILIDEPELSLHVLWQDSFIDDISLMGSHRNLRFLLATHSPALIAGRRELTYSLDAS